MELWMDGPGGRRGPKNIKDLKTDNNFNTERQQQRCIELASDGQYSKATKALVSPGPLARDENTEKAMKDKHPTAQASPDLSDLATPSRAQVPEIDSTLLKKMLKTFLFDWFVRFEQKTKES